MNRSIRVARGLSLMSTGALADTADMPGDFAYGIPIYTPHPAAAYRVAIPLDVYAKSTHEDLRDVRVFNAAGEVVPYEIEHTPFRAAPAPEAPGRSPSPFTLFCCNGPPMPRTSPAPCGLNPVMTCGGGVSSRATRR